MVCHTYTVEDVSAYHWSAAVTLRAQNALATITQSTAPYRIFNRSRWCRLSVVLALGALGADWRLRTAPRRPNPNANLKFISFCNRKLVFSSLSLSILKSCLPHVPLFVTTLPLRQQIFSAFIAFCYLIYCLV